MKKLSEPQDKPWVTVTQILEAHAEFGRVDYAMTKAAMGPNWPPEWDKLGPGQFIFEPGLAALREKE